MKRMLLSILISVGIILVPIQAKSQEISNLEGQIVPLIKDDKAPFTGILLDPLAAAKINTDKKYSLLENQLKLDYALKKQEADLNLIISNLQSRYDSLKESSGSIIKIKTEEIGRLQELATENSNDYIPLWISLGMAIGVALSIGIFYAAVETVN